MLLTLNRKLTSFISFFTVALSLAACRETPGKEDKKKDDKKQVQTLKASDALITTRCAIVIYPTLRQIDSMKKGVDSTDFYTAADDNVNYMSTAGEYLDSLKVKQVQKESKGIITFKTNLGAIYKVRLDTLYWSILLFNGKSKPIKADVTNIATDYKAYMDK